LARDGAAVTGEDAADLIDMAFPNSKKRADDRKRWLGGFVDGTRVDLDTDRLYVSDFINTASPTMNRVGSVDAFLIASGVVVARSRPAARCRVSHHLATSCLRCLQAAYQLQHQCGRRDAYRQCQQLEAPCVSSIQDAALLAAARSMDDEAMERHVHCASARAGNRGHAAWRCTIVEITA